METRDRLLVPTSRLKAAKLVGLGVPFVVMAAVFFDRPETGCFVIGVVTAALAAVAGGYGLYRTVRPGIAVLLDREGLVDHASAMGVGRIRWDEIRNEDPSRSSALSGLGSSWDRSSCLSREWRKR